MSHADSPSGHRAPHISRHVLRRQYAHILSRPLSRLINNETTSTTYSAHCLCYLTQCDKDRGPGRLGTSAPGVRTGSRGSAPQTSRRLTSPRMRNSELLPQPFGPQTSTFIPERTSKLSSCTRTSPLGVTRGTCSNLRHGRDVSGPAERLLTPVGCIVCLESIATWSWGRHPYRAVGFESHWRG